MVFSKCSAASSFFSSPMAVMDARLIATMQAKLFLMVLYKLFKLTGDVVYSTDDLLRVEIQR